MLTYLKGERQMCVERVPSLTVAVLAEILTIRISCVSKLTALTIGMLPSAALPRRCWLRGSHVTTPCNTPPPIANSAGTRPFPACELPDFRYPVRVRGWTRGPV